jgi:alkylhydroperoxidase family enzyme
VEKVLNSRFNMPALVPELLEISQALFKATGNGSLPPATLGLIRLRVCQITGSTYSIIRQTRGLRELGESEDRVDAVASWWDAPYFTDAEKAALALVEAVLQPSSAGKEKISDELYAQAAEHFDPKALATLSLTIGQAMLFTPIALIGRPPAGVPEGQQWT